MPKKFKKITAAPGEFCAWQIPTTPYLMKCCGCGLEHVAEFKVVRQLTNKNNKGWWKGEDVEDPTLRVALRMKQVSDGWRPIPKAPEVV